MDEDQFARQRRYRKKTQAKARAWDRFQELITAAAADIKDDGEYIQAVKTSYILAKAIEAAE